MNYDDWKATDSRFNDPFDPDSPQWRYADEDAFPLKSYWCKECGGKLWTPNDLKYEVCGWCTAVRLNNPHAGQG